MIQVTSLSTKTDNSQNTNNGVVWKTTGETTERIGTVEVSCLLDTCRVSYLLLLDVVIPHFMRKHHIIVHVEFEISTFTAVTAGTFDAYQGNTSSLHMNALQH